MTLVLILAASASKLNAQVTEWVSQFGSEGQISPDYFSAVDADGNIYVVGYTAGALSGQSSLGGVDAFLQKYDADGNEVWVRQFGTGTYDYALGSPSERQVFTFRDQLWGRYQVR